MILQRNALSEESVSRVIPVPVDKINKMAECGSPLLGVNDFFNNSCIII